MSFTDALVTFVSDQVTCRPLQPMLSTGSEEQQGQKIRVRPEFSDPVQNLGFTCIFSSGMQEYNFYGVSVVRCTGACIMFFKVSGALLYSVYVTNIHPQPIKP